MNRKIKYNPDHYDLSVESLYLYSGIEFERMDTDKRGTIKPEEMISVYALTIIQYILCLLLLFFQLQLHQL